MQYRFRWMSKPKSKATTTDALHSNGLRTDVLVLDRCTFGGESLSWIVETTVNNSRLFRCCLHGLWCFAGAIAVGVLLAYLGDWLLWLLAGLVVSLVLWSVLFSRDVSY
jgi:hypothetical protein